MSEDTRIVAAQLGREPEVEWRVAQRCSHGHPAVIANLPTARDGSPFPTLYWLTCPYLAEEIDSSESNGGLQAWNERVREDAHFRFEILAADQQYRAAREIEGAGEDPCKDVGIAGQADPFAMKCLHARVATALAGIPDPVGRAVLDGASHECTDDTCARLLVRYESEA